MSLDRANTKRVVSLFRMLLIPVRCQSKSIRPKKWVETSGGQQPWISRPLRVVTLLRRILLQILLQIHLRILPRRSLRQCLQARWLH